MCARVSHTVPSPRRIEARVRALPNRSVPNVRGVRRAVNREIAGASAKDVLAFAEALIVHTPYVPRWFAYELVHYHPAAMAALDASRLERLGAGIDDWHHVDPFGCYLTGPAWREGQVSDDRMHRWAKSRDLWWRRTALVSTVALNCTARGGAGDTKRTLAVCDLLLADREDMVVKALSWALRELASKDAASVRRYLTAHEDGMAARVRREVRNKLELGRKNPKRPRGPRA